MRLLTLLLATALVGCDGPEKIDTADTDTGEPAADIDGDGYTEADGDCDDGDATVNPGAEEIWYDGTDQNCDELSDYDQDRDSVDQEEDCDDENPEVSPDAAEICDEIDNNCDGVVDESGEYTAYPDVDGDGFGSGEPLGNYCELPAGTASNDEDCDDTNPAVSPVAEELCDTIDNDCNGEIDIAAVDGTMVYVDADADGYGDVGTGQVVCGEVEGTVTDATDCDDTDVLTFPGATELCDLKDNNCDGSVDEGSPDARTYYADSDADGYGDPAVSVSECGAPAGYVELDTDCDDADASLSPGVAEVCDGIDNNCDGGVDIDPTDGVAMYADADLDGYGDDTTVVTVCEAMAGYVDVGGDCDDASAATSPGAAEVCDTLDNNCDGATDESTATDAATWYVDADVDGYGDPAASATACDQPVGFVGDGADCNDTDATIFPDAPELCDEVDNDCDGTADDGASDATLWYADADGDSYGDASATTDSCDQPAGYVADDTDCDDTSALSYPGATETCDDQDQDCDGVVDDDPADGLTLYADADGDGYGDPVVSGIVCDAGGGWVDDASDCDDATFATNPGATETCDGVDNDCDGSMDGADAADAGTWYTDDDGDGYGSVSGATTACDAPAGTVANASDCDDAAGGTYPGAPETCDDADQDCDGTVDDNATDAATWYADADSDAYGNPSVTRDACDQPSGYVADDSDCDDTTSSAYPGATETCDDADNDCDGSVDESGATGELTWYLDADGDDYGVSTSTMDACDQPTGYTDDATDCDDDEFTANPGETELEDGIDNNCDGVIDEGFVDVGAVIVSEVARQVRVGGTSINTNAAWFEVYNTTSEDIELSNWYVQRQSSTLAADAFYIDPADGVIIGANSYAVFCKTDNFAAVSTSYSELICDYFWGDESASSSYAGTYQDNTFNMQRDEDTLSLWYGGPTGTQIDAVSWTYDATDGYWPRDASRSMQLDTAALDHTSNDDLANWCSTTNNVYFQWYYVSASNREFGTPGTAGHTCP